MKNKYQKNKKLVSIFAGLFVFGFVFCAQNFLVVSPALAGWGDGLVDAMSNGADESMVNAPTSTSDLAEDMIQKVLHWVMMTVGFMISIGATLLEWTLSPELWGQGGFLDKPVVYQTWSIFRDLFNMGFILMLLYSAFATIFQVDRHNIKDIYVSFLIAILLINFSFPIVRIIIDISNVMMFSFLNGSSGLIMATDFMSYTGVEKAILPDGYAKYSIPYLLAAIVFVFVLGVTLTVLGFLMMIRLIALAILIMSAPVGFVGSVFPGIGGLSSKWWNNLYNYAFFGPIMVFILLLANALMANVGTSARSKLTDMASSNAVGDLANWIGNAAYFLMPVALIWIGMGIAQNMSIWGADKVVSKGQGFSKWMGRNLGGSRQMLRWTGVSGGANAAWQDFKKTGFKGGLNKLYGGQETQALRDSRWEARFNRMAGDKDASAAGAQAEFARGKALEIRKKWKDAGGAQISDLQNMLKGGSEQEKIAAAMEMAENTGFGEKTASDAEKSANYQMALAVLEQHKVQKNIFEDKVKEKHILTKIKAEGGKLEDFKKNLSGMNASKMVKQKGLLSDEGMHEYIKDKFNSTDRKQIKNATKFLNDLTKDNGATESDKEAMRNSGIQI